MSLAGCPLMYLTLHSVAFCLTVHCPDLPVLCSVGEQTDWFQRGGWAWLLPGWDEGAGVVGTKHTSSHSATHTTPP